MASPRWLEAGFPGYFPKLLQAKAHIVVQLASTPHAVRGFSHRRARRVNVWDSRFCEFFSQTDWQKQLRPSNLRGQ